MSKMSNNIDDPNAVRREDAINPRGGERSSPQMVVNDTGSNVARIFRRQPFCWQTKSILRAIRAEHKRLLSVKAPAEKLTDIRLAREVYFALTEIDSDLGSPEAVKVSRKSVADYALISFGGARRGLAVLEDMGILRVERKKLTSKSNDFNAYYFNEDTPRPATDPGVGSQQTHPGAPGRPLLEASNAEASNTENSRHFSKSPLPDTTKDLATTKDSRKETGICWPARRGPGDALALALGRVERHNLKFPAAYVQFSNAIKEMSRLRTGKPSNEQPHGYLMHPFFFVDQPWAMPLLAYGLAHFETKGDLHIAQWGFPGKGNLEGWYDASVHPGDDFERQRVFDFAALKYTRHTWTEATPKVWLATMAARWEAFNAK